MRKIFFLVLLSCVGLVKGQDVERVRPQEWNGIVTGARFQDRFLPMNGMQRQQNGWGTCDVSQRWVDNGIEDEHISYWGGNILKIDSLYHLIVCGWLENSEEGHMAWKNSTVFRAVSNHPEGPFKPVDILGFGHNPEVYKAKNGEYVLAVMRNWKPYYAVSKRIDKKWDFKDFPYNTRGRKVIEGLSNLSFTSREDGSVLMVCRGGGIWISPDGIAPFEQITTGSIYPAREGRFEDPVIWRDSTQYNLIVNDWLGRVAYYMRSSDGVHWIEDPGEAYSPGIACHQDGTIENWYKFERIKVQQDTQGRAIYANFAVCDTLKHYDLGDDRHSSKNVIIPLNKGLLLSVDENKDLNRTRQFKIKVQAEPGFNPHDDLDISSIRFGASKDVNYGQGLKVKDVEILGEDIILTFDTRGYTITDDEFAPKLLGKKRDGEMIFGYIKNPLIKQEPILSCSEPKIEDSRLRVKITNYGLTKNYNEVLRIVIKGHEVSKIKIPTLDSYDSEWLTFEHIDRKSTSDVVFEVLNSSNKVVNREQLSIID